MRTWSTRFFVSLAAALAAASLPAQVVLTSTTANAKAWGSTTLSQNFGGASQSYNDVQSQTGTSLAFSGAAAGSASVTATPPYPYPIYLGPTLSASSSAAHTANVSTSAIHIDGQLSAATGINSQIGGLAASASALCDVAFHLDTAAFYTAQIDGTFYQNLSYMFPPNYTFALTSLNSGDVFGNGGNHPYLYTFSASGMLLPGDYHFVSSVTSYASMDPLGDSGSSTYRVRLNFTSVPEQSSTLWLVVCCAPVFVFFSRRTTLPR